MLELLALIVVANSAPVLARNLLGARGEWPLDGGLVLRDGRPLLGSSKTWRGLFAALAACAAAAPLLGLTWALGLAVAALSMAGDLAASFAKRRRGYAPSDHAPLLDSVPEALLPACALYRPFELAWFDPPLIVALFYLAVRLGSPLLYRLHLRRHPW